MNFELQGTLVHTGVRWGHEEFFCHMFWSLCCDPLQWQVQIQSYLYNRKDKYNKCYSTAELFPTCHVEMGI